MVCKVHGEEFLLRVLQKCKKCFVFLLQLLCNFTNWIYKDVIRNVECYAVLRVQHFHPCTHIISAQGVESRKQCFTEHFHLFENLLSNSK